MLIGNTIQDRRAYSRLKTEIPCWIDVGGNSHEAVLHELSLATAVIASPPLTIGSDIKLSIEIPESAETVSILGQVVGSNEDMKDGSDDLRYIVRFGSISPESSFLMMSLQSRHDESIRQESAGDD